LRSTEGFVFNLCEVFNASIADEIFGLNLVGKFTDWVDEEGKVDPDLLGMCKDNIEQALQEFKEQRGELRAQPEEILHELGN
jgi:hypothetical protein